jgi:Ser/Thr protein kinase RdoA (MazF antagonist)
VPAFYDFVTVDGRPGAIVDRIDGEDLMTMLGDRPWRVRSVGLISGALHARVHELNAPGELPSLKDELNARLHSPLVPQVIQDTALANLALLPDGDRLCHGDYHPGNVLTARDGHLVIDWTRAARGDPAADVAATRLLLTAGTVPRDAPFLVRRLDKFGRRLLLDTYERGYRRGQQLDADMVERWGRVCIAARLADDIENEREGVT